MHSEHGKACLNNDDNFCPVMLRKMVSGDEQLLQGLPHQAAQATYMWNEPSKHLNWHVIHHLIHCKRAYMYIPIGCPKLDDNDQGWIIIKNGARIVLWSNSSPSLIQLLEGFSNAASQVTKYCCLASAG